MAQNKLTISEAAERLGVGYRRARQLIALGELKATNTAAPGARPVWRVSHQAVAAAKRRRPVRKRSGA